MIRSSPNFFFDCLLVKILQLITPPPHNHGFLRIGDPTRYNYAFGFQGEIYRPRQVPFLIELVLYKSSLIRNQSFASY